MDVDEDGKNPASSDEELEDVEGDAEVAGSSRRSRARGAKKVDSAKENMGDATERRTSSRATKFKSSMKEPSDKSIRDLFRDTNNEKASARRKGSRLQMMIWM